MLAIVIILATLLAISAGLHVYQAQNLRKWEGFDEASTKVLADAIRNTDAARQETSRWRQRVFSTLDRNLWLRTRLEELQIQYDDLFVKYAKQSLSATEVTEDEAEILEPMLATFTTAEYLAEHGHWIEGMGYVKWVEGEGYVPLPDQPDGVSIDQPIDTRDVGRKPILVSPPFVNDVEEVDPEVSIDYYVVDRGE